MMENASCSIKHGNSLDRLKRIEGQTKGIVKMVEQDKYCIDIINQISAVKGALNQVALLILQNHVESCVSEAVKNADEQEKEEKIEELIDTVKKFVK
ncbi:metal-sensitive transcriptional regulator [Flexistipes sp.]|uniref:metal-sensitive transcriptional regulator n=1 Tax=Flexistipes sp. TaxID=3088135 RepID=UPI002E1C4D09|nr:metal-sensitive transcriptional regulator [Flexistipes sp.]